MKISVSTLLFSTTFIILINMKFILTRQTPEKHREMDSSILENLSRQRRQQIYISEVESTSSMSSPSHHNYIVESPITSPSSQSEHSINHQIITSLSDQSNSANSNSIHSEDMSHVNLISPSTTNWTIGTTRPSTSSRTVTRDNNSSNKEIRNKFLRFFRSFCKDVKSCVFQRNRTRE